MTWFRRRRRREAELDEEIQGHLAMAAREHEAQGESPPQAAYAARREFGNATLVKELTRQSWGAVWLDQLGQDLRLAARSLRRSPAFTITVAGMLGLGLGAASAMYGMLDRLLLRAPEHVSDQDRLFAAYITSADPRGGEVTRGMMQWREYRLLSDGMSGSAVCAALTAPIASRFSLGLGQVKAQRVMASAGYFDVLGVHAWLGRLFLPEDSASSAPPVAVISYGFWQRQFGGARDVLGSRLREGTVLYTIVGIAPRGFSGATPERVDVWLPAGQAGPAAFGSQWELNNYVWQLIARTQAGHSAAQAAAAGFIRLRAAPVPPRYGTVGYTGIRASSIIPGRAPTGPTSALRLSYIVAGVAILMAIIALANAAGLLFLRALRRQRETAVRLVRDRRKTTPRFAA